MKNWKVGEKISTVLNYPVLMDGTVPMHVLLEVVGVITLEGAKVPRCKSVGIAPIEDQQKILRLLADNKDFPPNTLRLMMKRLHDEMNDATEALNFFQQNLLLDFDAEITHQAGLHQQAIEKRRAMGNPTKRDPFQNGEEK